MEIPAVSSTYLFVRNAFEKVRWLHGTCALLGTEGGSHIIKGTQN